MTNQTIAPGTRFWQLYQGHTRTGFGQVSKIYEVVEQVKGDYSCKPISDNTVSKVNPNYIQIFTGEEIRKILTDNPIINTQNLKQ